MAWGFLGLCVAALTGALGMHIALSEGNTWANNHAWLLSALYALAALFALCSIAFSRWFRSIYQSVEQPAIQQETRGSASHNITAMHGSTINIHADTSTSIPLAKKSQIETAGSSLLTTKDTMASPHEIATSHLSQPEKLTLYDLFVTDFKGSQKIGGHCTATRENRAVVLEQYVVIDLERRTKVIEFYIPHWDDTHGVAAYLVGCP